MNPITLPYDASAIAANHSSITGLIAGFALAGLFLLVERVGSSSGKVRVQYLRAMLLLFITSVIATLAAFLYSSIVGIPELRAYFTFVMTSSIFAISAIVLLLGITTVFSAFSVSQSLNLARRISYFVILFSVLRVWDDFNVAITTFDLNTMLPIVLLLIFIVPYGIGTLLLITQPQGIMSWFQNRSFTAYCYSTVAVCLGIAFLISLLNIRPETQLRIQIWQPVLLISLVTLLGTWTMLLLPQHTMESTD